MRQKAQMAQVEQQTLTSHIHQHLLSKLASGEYATGSHLKAATLAAELDVSRTTIRKAIEQLIEEGWVKVDPSRYPIVVKTPRQLSSQHESQFEHSNQTERIYQAIQKKVFSGDYRAGDTIRSQQLADELKVSKVTVHQALDWLCRDGLLVRIPRRGWQVVTRTPSELRDIYHCRLLLEPLVLKKAVRQIRDGTLEELIAQCDATIASIETVSRYDRLEIDMRFHRTLLENAHSRTLSEVIEPLIRVRMIFIGEFDEKHRPETFAHEHKTILEALRNRDATTAIKRMKEHLRRALNDHLK